jgi:predicted DNA-binding transcriptional regulator AlpA
MRNDNELLISRSEAAAILGFSPDTLAHWAVRGVGPKFIRVGGRVRYRLRELHSWINSRPEGGAL